IRYCQIRNLEKVVSNSTSPTSSSISSALRTFQRLTMAQGGARLSRGLQGEIENSTSSKWSYRPSPRNSWTKGADNDRYRQTTVSKLPLQSSSAPGSTHY